MTEGASASADRVLVPSGPEPVPVSAHSGDAPLRGATVCRCGAPKLRQSKGCAACYRPRWSAEQDDELREFVAAGWEYERIARRLNRTNEACRNRASFLGVKQDRSATLENRQRGRERFASDPAKVARRSKRASRAFTPERRAKRAEEARQRNLFGTFGFKGRKHTPETLARLSAASKGPKSAETRRKMSVAAFARWAAKFSRRSEAAYRAVMAAGRNRLASRDPETETARQWCAQCERLVAVLEASACQSRFCKAKALAA